MKRRRARRRRGAAIIAVLCIAALAVWQWQTVVRLAVVAVVDNVGQVRVSFGRSAFGWNEARLENVRVTSRRGEAIAEIARLRIAYEPRDWLPGGKRLFGLVAVEADAPHLTILRRPDGSYNVPIPNLQAGRPSPGRALVLSARVTNGSIDVINERPLAPPGQRHLYVRGLAAAADLGTARSHYAVGFGYGERADRLYPVRGRGDIDPGDGYVNQRWTANELPIAGAVNFALDSASLRFLGGTLQNADLRYVGLRGPDGTLAPHLAASALLDGGRISIAGLSKPVHDIRGPIDAYDDGLLTPGFGAILAGTRVRVSGGIYNVRDPRLRVVVNGSGSAAALRSAIAQAQRLPIEGPLSFRLLVEGNPANPVTWVALRSARITYAATSVDRVSGLVALEGRAADIVRFDAAYDRVELSVRGRVGFAREPGAIELLLGIDAPPGGVPYVGTLLPAVPLRATAVATADDPKAIAAQGALWGAGATQQLNALFNVDSRGRGSVGPLHLRNAGHSLYARVALDRPAGVTLGLLAARDFALPSAHAVLDANAVGAQTKSGIEAGVAGRVTSAWGAADARGTVALSGGALRGSLFGNAGREASFGATLAGTPQAPRVAGTVVVAGGRYKDFEINGDAGMAYDRGVLQLHDAAVAVGPLFLGVAGTIDGLSPHGAFAPRVDLAAQVHTSDVRTLLATVQPRAAKLVEGSLDADVRVRGAALTPSVAGVVRAPEGSVNGLAFRDLHGAVRGTLAAASLRDGRVVIGETAVGFHGDRVGSRTSIALDAPQADLADFNDYFDTGDTLAGTGRLAARATLDGTRVVATSGDANLSNARYLRLDVGSVAARWTTRRSAVATTLSLGGAAGRLNVAGSVTPATMSVNLTANANGVDLGTWLPMLGLNAPITGRLDAQTTVAGRYPDVGLRLHAAVFGGTAGRLSIDRFEMTASAAHGRGTLSSAILDVSGLSTTASGTFGLRENDPIALVAHSTSADIGALLLHATGKKASLAGALDSTLRLEGTRAAPRLRDAMTLSSLRYGNLTLPRVAATIEADRRALRVESGEVDLERGRALLSALVPVNLSRAKIALDGAPISASLRADDVELSNFAALLPKGTSVAGRIDGQVSAGGTLESPRFDGALQLRGGRFSGPIERTPVENIVADLTFAGQRASLQSRAAAGGGALTADGSATLGSLRNPAASALSLRATAAKAKLDMPDYFQGLLDADVSVARAAFAAPRVGGSVSVSNARIPLNAFLNQKGSSNAHPSVPDVAFGGLRIAAGPNVRIQSRNVDIGATGDAALNGTLEAPTLTGEFRSAGGSLSFYRNFNVEKGTVSFNASSGVIPDIDAVATTFVPDPATAIRLHVTGPATDMNLALASDPAYSREQILGILVGAQQFGAVRGVRSSGQTFSAGAAATNVALGQLNDAFTRNLLEPLNAQLAGTLGFSEVRLTTDIQTGVGVSAVKAFGKNVNAIFGQTFGYPRTQSVTFEAHPSVGTGLSLMVYSAQGPSVLGLAQQQPVGLDVMNLNPLTAFTPTSGTNGFTFSYQRKFP